MIDKQSIISYGISCGVLLSNKRELVTNTCNKKYSITLRPMATKRLQQYQAVH